MRSPDRVQLKLAAKQKLSDRSLGVMAVTLIYLALTDWLQTAAELVLENPLSVLISRYADLLGDAAGQYGASLTASEQSFIMSSLQQTAQELLSRPLNQAALFFFLLLYLYSTVLSFGYSGYAMKVLRGGFPGWQSLFEPFYLAGKFIILHLITMIVSAVGTLFFVFPGVWFYYSVQQAPYLLLDDPELSVFQALHRSFQLSRGNKMNLFVLDLSFIGWLIAVYAATEVGIVLGQLVGGTVAATIFSTITYAAVAVYLLPYQELSRVGFYEVLREGAESEGSCEII